MRRFFLAMCVAVFAAVLGTSAASAAVADPGPPYTDEQFLAIAAERLPNQFNRDSLRDWWARAPGYLRKRILNAPSDMWWPIILCNYLGYKPEGMPPGGAEKCEQDAYGSMRRGRNSWSPDGTWVGPSEECRKRDKRTQWGELICD